MNDERRRLRAYCGSLAVFLFFWWPLSHWFYSDWYHALVGFERYDPMFVKLIGTMGVLPVVALLWTALRPEEGGAFAVGFLAWSLGMAATYVYLILVEGFPKGELFNVALLLLNAAAYPFVFRAARGGEARPELDGEVAP